MAPQLVFEEAREHPQGILDRRKSPAPSAIVGLELLSRLVRTVETDSYAAFEATARERIDRRDEDDWPVLAVALDCPIGTEDTDFFVCGVATWTTDRVELYLARAAAD